MLHAASACTTWRYHVTGILKEEFLGDYDLQLAQGRLAGKLERVVGLAVEERAR